jgi:hypothetical protein
LGGCAFIDVLLDGARHVTLAVESMTLVQYAALSFASAFAEPLPSR